MKFLLYFTSNQAVTLWPSFSNALASLTTWNSPWKWIWFWYFLTCFDDSSPPVFWFLGFQVSFVLVKNPYFCWFKLHFSSLFLLVLNSGSCAIIGQKRVQFRVASLVFVPPGIIMAMDNHGKSLSFSYIFIDFPIKNTFFLWTSKYIQLPSSKLT